MFRSITANRFRGFRKLHIKPLDRFNLILGRNNVGKTAILEAAYLLLGPTNPELPLRINAFRGIEVVKADPEEMWGWLFGGKKLDSTIELEAECANGKSRTLKISLQAPTTVRIPSSRSSRSGRRRIAKIRGTNTTDAALSELVLEYASETGSKASTRAYIKESTLNFDRAKAVHLPTSIFMTSRAGYSTENPERFSKLEEVGDADQLVQPLAVLEPRLKRLAVLVTGNGPMIHGDIGIGRLVPVPMMGEGIGKLLTLLLSIVTSKGGVVLVDEIESGLHYSAMADVWAAVAKMCRTHNVQLVATTHSWECVRAAHQAFVDPGPYDFCLHRLDRNKSDDIQAATFDREMLDVALTSGMELR